MDKNGLHTSTLGKLSNSVESGNTHALQLLSQQQAETLLARLFSQSVPFSFNIAADDYQLAIALKNKGDIIVNRDKSVTWTVTEISVGLHSFIELITGEETKRKVYIPLCLVSAESRQPLMFLLNSTRDPSDGRFNSKDAEFYIVAPNKEAVLVHMKLEGLATYYALMQAFPVDFACRYASEYCPFCRDQSRALKGGETYGD